MHEYSSAHKKRDTQLVLSAYHSFLFLESSLESNVHHMVLSLTRKREQVLSPVGSGGIIIKKEQVRPIFGYFHQIFHFFDKIFQYFHSINDFIKYLMTYCIFQYRASWNHIRTKYICAWKIKSSLAVNVPSKMTAQL